MLLQYGWHFLLTAIMGEMLTPFLLGLFYKGYRHSEMAISVLGNEKSPVRMPFRLWMLSAGILFLLSLPAVYAGCRGVSAGLAWGCVICIAVFAVGACILSCFFSVGEDKAELTRAAKIHGAGSAIGFMLLLTVPVQLAVLSFRAGAYGAGAACAADFVLAAASFALFIMADKAEFANTWIAKEGLWQRLNLLFMYLPLAYLAARSIT